MLIMNRYYLNRQRQPNGDLEVHREWCKYMPSQNNRLYIGQFYSDITAVNTAKKLYPQCASSINGCRHCCSNSDTD